MSAVKTTNTAKNTATNSATGRRKGPQLTANGQPRHKRPSARGKVAALLTPALVLIGVIILYPLLSGVVLSFKSDPVLNRHDGFFYPGCLLYTSPSPRD